MGRGVISCELMRDVVVDTHDRLTAELRDRIQQVSASAIAVRRRFTMAIAGGSVAEVLLPPLATSAVDWSKVDVFWCDERAVPPNDPESNYGSALDLLFAHAPASAATLHRMPADAFDLDAAAREYEAALRAASAGAPLDLALIGAGLDGHICALFPGRPALEERERWVVAIEDSPKPPPRRLTLTLPVLEAARTLVLGIFGRDKAAMVKALLEQPNSQLPAARALRGNPNSVCLLDREAASLLTRE
jgi:6-phosphogluconolactonase